MESDLIRGAQAAMDEATNGLTAEERLNAFLTHCELMAEMLAAGQTDADGIRE